MAINQYSRAIAILPSLEAIGQAVDQLVFSGFPLAQIFLVGKDPQVTIREDANRIGKVSVKELLHEANLDTITGSTTTLKRGVMVGNLTGGITGLLVGIGLLTVPGVGEIVLASAFLYLLSTVGIGTLTGGALGALVGQGITERLAKSYTDQVAQGNYLLIVSGSESDIFRAEQILYIQGIQSHRWSQ